MARFTIKVNGTAHAIEADPEMPLLYALRDDLQLNNPHFGCGFSRLAGSQSRRGTEVNCRGMGKTVASKKVVIAREGGRSSTPRLLDSITIASGILVPRFRGDDT